MKRRSLLLSLLAPFLPRLRKQKSQVDTAAFLRGLQMANLNLMSAFRTYDVDFGRTGQKIGQTLQIRKPPRYLVGDSSATAQG